MTLVRAMRWVLMEEAGAATGGAGGAVDGDAGGNTVLGGGGATTTQGAGGNTDAVGTGAASGEGAASSGSVAGVETNPAGAATAENESQNVASGDAIEYTDFAVPEGITLNADLLGEFKGIAQSMGLKQEQAQQLTDLGVKLTNGLLAQQAQALEAQKTTWYNETKADAEIGGDKFDVSMAAAARAVKQFVPDELKALFDQTGIGNHPALVKAFVKIGGMLKEDGVVAGSANIAGGKDAKSLYPNSPGLV